MPAKVFTWLTSISTFGAIWTWGIILVAQIKFRKSLPTQNKQKLSYKMPLYPLSSYFSLAFLALVLCIMAYSEDTRIALIVGPIWLIGLAVVYYMKGFHKIDETPNSKLVKQNIPSLLLEGIFLCLYKYFSTNFTVFLQIFNIFYVFRLYFYRKINYIIKAHIFIIRGFFYEE